MVGAHTDSPNIRLKPRLAKSAHKHLLLDTETYGGLFIATWADRDLSVAGRVVLQEGIELSSVLFRSAAPICRIPNLAIHLNRGVNDQGLVLNKSDLLDKETFALRRQAVLDALGWQGRVYEIAAINGGGTGPLCGDLMTRLEERIALEQADPELAEAERQEQLAMQDEARQRVEEYRASCRQRPEGEEGAGDFDDEDDDFDDDDDVEVEYVP